MNPEPEQAKPQAEPSPSKKRAGVPVWRTGKPDAVLAAAVDVARTAIEGIAKASEIGEHLAARTEGDRLVTHLFESKLPGYVGWQWYAVLTRNSRSKVVTVSELGLLPSEDSILAPEWVPWAERVRPEDAPTDVQEDAQVDAAVQETEDGAAGPAGPAAEPDRESGGEPDGGLAAEGAVSPEEPAGRSDDGPANDSQYGSNQDEDIAEVDSPSRG